MLAPLYQECCLDQTQRVSPSAFNQAKGEIREMTASGLHKFLISYVRLGLAISPVRWPHWLPALNHFHSPRILTTHFLIRFTVSSHLLLDLPSWYFTRRFTANTQYTFLISPPQCQGCTGFPESRITLNKFHIEGPQNIRRHRTRFSRPSDLASGICAPLI